jgi:hypothetical protein
MIMRRFVRFTWGAVIALCLCSVGAYGDEPAAFHPFVKGEYGAADFNVTTHTYAHGRVKIRITQAQRTGSHEKAPPYSCRAWLEIAEKGENIWQKSFDDINPADFSYGLFVPRKAPSPRYFAVVKVGDNDGRLFLIDREDGTVFALPGGFYFITADKRFLFSEYAGETQDLVVFDLIAGKVVLDTKSSEADRLPGEIYDWYYDGKRYFFSIVRDDEKRKGVIAEDRRVLYEVTLRHPGISRVAADFSRIFHKKWDFDPRPFKDCCSDPGISKEEKSGGEDQSQGEATPR